MPAGESIPDEVFEGPHKTRVIIEIPIGVYHVAGVLAEDHGYTREQVIGMLAEEGMKHQNLSPAQTRRVQEAELEHISSIANAYRFLHDQPPEHGR